MPQPWLIPKLKPSPFPSRVVVVPVLVLLFESCYRSSGLVQQAQSGIDIPVPVNEKPFEKHCTLQRQQDASANSFMASSSDYRSSGQYCRRNKAQHTRRIRVSGCSSVFSILLSALSAVYYVYSFICDSMMSDPVVMEDP
jgi:hypothetical protein